jgi:hypothetical protein
VNEPALTRRDELLADGVLGWLEGGDDAALHAVLRDASARRELLALERTAALASRALAPVEDDQHPRLVGLAAKLHGDAMAFLAAGAAPRAVEAPASVAPARRRLLPWAIAAAAIVLAMWRGREEAGLAPPRARDALLRSRDGLLTCTWQPGPASDQRTAVGGDVVWNPARQEGYLRLQGLPALDPAHRYQLWIVDAAREGPPVDGGLLPPLAHDGEAVVRIDARLPVQRAAAFVLTRERAEGAVVSAQDHVVAIAKP